MTIHSLTNSFPWTRYSKKIAKKIENPHNVGAFNRNESEARGMRLVETDEGSCSEGNWLSFYWLVDEDDGIIVDTRFQLFGQSALIAAADVACELLVGKNYSQAARISADLIDRQLRDKPECAAFPREAFPLLNMVVDAIEKGVEQCMDIPIAASYTAPPAPFAAGEGDATRGGFPGWETLSIEGKIAAIDDVLDQDVRPYIALDAGGVEVINLLNDTEVIIAYSGACTSCYASVGSTLSYIQQTLRNKIDRNLTVTPNLEFEG